MNLRDKLQGMIGYSYLYNAREHKILNFKITDNMVIIGTDRDIFEFEKSKIDIKIGLFLPINIKNITQGEQSKNLPKENIIEFHELANILVENINKVKEDVKYIPTAKAINDSINTFVNLTKVKIELMRLNK